MGKGGPTRHETPTTREGDDPSIAEPFVLVLKDDPGCAKCPNSLPSTMPRRPSSAHTGPKGNHDGHHHEPSTSRTPTANFSSRVAFPTSKLPHNPGHCAFSNGGKCFPCDFGAYILCVAVIPHLTQLRCRVRSTPLLFCDVCGHVGNEE